MKFFAFLAVAVACACAAEIPVNYKSTEYDAPILRSEFEISPEGQFNYIYGTGNGIEHHASGGLKAISADELAQEIKGEYSYTAPNGEPISVTYVANEDGFQAVGNHIPTTPPVPELILRGLAYIESRPQPVAEYLVKKN